MKETTKADYKRRYAMARHHAWAGSVLLAILGAVRWFVIETTYPNKDEIFIVVGTILILYILVALIFTYRFRSGLLEEKSKTEQKTSNQSTESTSSTESFAAKEKAKIEKKKVKAESKRLKKLAKAQEKKNKKS